MPGRVSTMKKPRYSQTRQRACLNCQNSKARCDRQNGGCGRCKDRGIDCTLRREGGERTSSRGHSTQQQLPINSDGPCSTASQQASLNINFGDETTFPVGAIRLSDFSMANSASLSIPGDTSNSPATHSLTSGRTTFSSAVPSNASLRRNTNAQDIIDFSGLALICPINVDGIISRWMNPFIPDPEQRVKQYPASIIAFISRIFKSYAGSAIRGHGILPFIHPIQLKSQVPNVPLTTCLNLVRMCQNQLPGSENSAVIIIQREMDNIIESREIYDDISLLAAFQAYLIYSMVLYFRLDVARDHSLRQTMITLQELAHASCKGGLVCVADETRSRPRWEEWIATEAKRRTLYMMYLFDSVISTQENVQTYLGSELQGLPAPASRSLWEADTRSDWEQAYNVFLGEWMEPGLAIDELWGIPEEMNEVEVADRRGRVDHWLEDIDAFGTMLYAVTSCTHGG